MTHKQRLQLIRQRQAYRDYLAGIGDGDRSGDVVEQIDIADEREVVQHAANVGANHVAFARGIDTRDVPQIGRRR